MTLLLKLLFPFFINFVWSYSINGFGHSLYGGLGNGVITERTNPMLVGGSNSDIKSIYASQFVSFIIKKNGTAYSFGRNHHGQRGDGTKTTKTAPSQIHGEHPIVKDIAVYEHLLIINNVGQVYGAGANQRGQLGDNTTTSRLSFALVKNDDSNSIAVSAGSAFSLILKANGAVYSFGYNNNGQLGDGTNVQKYIPTLIQGTNAIAISSGLSHSLLLKSNGMVHSFGANFYGQLGDGTSINRNAPTIVQGDSNIAISAGYDYSLLLKSNGSVFAFGYNFHGALGDGTNTNRLVPTPLKGENTQITSISASYHSLVRKSNGLVYSFGFNSRGQLGDGTKINRNTLTLVPGGNYSAVSAGILHSLLLHANGSAFSFGDDDYGELGLGTMIEQSSPMPISSDNYSIKKVAMDGGSTYILKENGVVYGFGINSYGQLGDETTENRNVPIRLNQKENSNVKSMSLNNGCGLLLKNNGALYGIGFNGYGQLGDGTLTNRNFFAPIHGDNTNIIDVAAGVFHVLILKSNGMVYSFGSNTWGQLGDNTTVQRTVPTLVKGDNTDIIAITTSYTFSLILKKNGSVLGFGQNQFGQLGDGTTMNRYIPTLVIGSSDIIAISAGGFHSILLDKRGSVYSFGYNLQGQLGDGTYNNRNISQIVHGVGNITAVATGLYHTLLLANNGKVYAFGSNNKGQLGDGTTTDRIIPTFIQSSDKIVGIAAGGERSFILIQEIQCFEKDSMDPTVCSGHGVCVSHNNCTCNSGFAGNECQLCLGTTVTCDASSYVISFALFCLVLIYI